MGGTRAMAERPGYECTLLRRLTGVDGLWQLCPCDEGLGLVNGSRLRLGSSRLFRRALAGWQPSSAKLCETKRLSDSRRRRQAAWRAKDSAGRGWAV